MSIEVKICGLNRMDSVAAAVAGGARYVGFVFPALAAVMDFAGAATLASSVPAGKLRVGLSSMPKMICCGKSLRTVPLEMLQLHGGEPPPGVAEIRERFGLPVIKAISVTSDTDFQVVPEYEQVADRLLFDARLPLDATGLAATRATFDWRLVGCRSQLTLAACRRSLLRATGPRPCGTVGSAAATVDVSSGVEDAPGHIKRREKFTTFLQRLPAFDCTRGCRAYAQSRMRAAVLARARPGEATAARRWRLEHGSGIWWA